MTLLLLCRAADGTAAQVAAQKAWLTADLKAVDRSATPWLLVACHKAPWDKNTDWAALGFDTLFDTYQVDIVFLGCVRRAEEEGEEGSAILPSLSPSLHAGTRTTTSATSPWTRPRRPPTPPA